MLTAGDVLAAAQSSEKPHFLLETKLQQKQYGLVAGIDEVGRGPLAGPVVAAAVILSKGNLPKGLNDSKKLSFSRRLSCYDEIMEKAQAVCVASYNAETIDKINIREASLAAMRQALLGLSIAPDFALIDGRDIPQFLPCPALAVIKGDGLCASIAAASIIAKVVRDKMMMQTAQFYPDYGFNKHMGYGTEQHRNQLKEKGAIKRLHRYSFAPLKNN